MSRRRICSLLFTGLLFTSSAFASVLYVGTCHSPSYSTISAPVAAAQPGATINVCPGRYLEQIVITQAVTLKGIPSNNLEQAIVLSPPNGMVINASDNMDDPIAAQLFVEANPGLTQISNLTLDASNNQVSDGIYVVGILVQNSPAAINHIVTQNKIGGDGGVGVWIQGGASNPPVTIENSSIHDFDDIGIWTQISPGPQQLTAVIQDNFVVADARRW